MSSKKIDFLEYRLNEIAHIFNQKRIPLNSRDRKDRKGEFPYYGASGVVDYIDDYIFDGEYVLISEDGENLRTRKTPIAFKAEGKFWVNNHAHILQGKEEFINEYITYYFSSIDINPYVTGAVQPKLNKENLLKIPIYIPQKKDIRNKIVLILKSLDDKIELNRQTNQTLENIAQTLFKEWFINYNYPNATGEMQDSELGQIPRGWRVYKISDLVDSISETFKFKEEQEVIFLNTSDIEEGKILHKNYSLSSNLPGQAKKKIKKLDILFTEIRPANKRYALIDFDTDDFVVSTKLMVLRTKTFVSSILIYNFLTNENTLSILQHFAETRSGTFPQITFNILGELKIALPYGGALLKSYEDLAWSIFKSTKINSQQNQTLTQLRDTLLPKLMKGEVELNGVD